MTDTDIAAEPGKEGRRVERQFSINCLLCAQSTDPDVRSKSRLICPREAAPWHWLKNGDVMDFKKLHLSHGSERTVGIQMEMVEVEE